MSHAKGREHLLRRDRNKLPLPKPSHLIDVLIGNGLLKFLDYLAGSKKYRGCKNIHLAALNTLYLESENSVFRIYQTDPPAISPSHKP